MFLTRQRSRAFDPARVVDPDHRGGVAWADFNASFSTLQKTSWRDVNRGTQHGLLMRIARMYLAFVAEKRGSILDLRGKARAFARLDLPRDPDIVFFGAEVGWEAHIIQSIYGDKGRVVLIDNDPAAYARWQESPREIQGFSRDPAKVEYVREDFFDAKVDRPFDVGIDWGIIEHYPDERKPAVLACFKRYLKPGGVEISSCPRDRLIVRAFYRAFADELNFGYRELMTLNELEKHLVAAGLTPYRSIALSAHNIIASRV